MLQREAQKRRDSKHELQPETENPTKTGASLARTKKASPPRRRRASDSALKQLLALYSRSSSHSSFTPPHSPRGFDRRKPVWTSHSKPLHKKTPNHSPPPTTHSQPSFSFSSSNSSLPSSLSSTLRSHRL